MSSKKNRKLSSVVLAGTFVAPAIMSAAQQNTASANLGDLLKLESIETGLKTAWANPVGRGSILFVGLVGVIALGGVIIEVAKKGFEHILGNDDNITLYNKDRVKM